MGQHGKYWVGAIDKQGHALEGSLARSTLCRSELWRLRKQFSTITDKIYVLVVKDIG